MRVGNPAINVTWTFKVFTNHHYLTYEMFLKVNDAIQFLVRRSTLTHELVKAEIPVKHIEVWGQK